jgi:hypothetical protein
LKLHRFKENATIDTVLELFLANNCPNYPDFCALIEKSFDFECLEMVKDFVAKVCAAHKKMKKGTTELIRWGNFSVPKFLSLVLL